MRSRFALKPEEIVPRSLRQLVVEADPRAKEAARRRRSRKVMTLRRTT